MRAQAATGAMVPSAAITNVRYDVTFDSVTAQTHTIRVAMSFDVSGPAPVILSLPAWTPGAYEITNFARWVSAFGANSGREAGGAAGAIGGALIWDKVDPDTWRVRPGSAKSVTVHYDVLADSLDNAMAWSKADFALFNGTNVFLYAEGRPLEFAATVAVHTATGWLVATGMTATADRPAGAPTARTFTASNYHDLVDMPFFVGSFDFDSAQISGRWTRFASYPAGSVRGPQRTEVWDQLKKVIPPEVAVFGEAPWQNYTVMQIADDSYAGASGLEHQSSHVDVITPLAVGHPFMPSLYAHEIFHAWNVKRLRPADLWPYQYDRRQPTTLLWVSEGITDYYADLALVRGGVRDSSEFFSLTSDKMKEVADAIPVSLEDASLSTWIQPADGTGLIYYPKGSLAGFMLDIMIRDASDNRRSLDDVMRDLYQTAYKAGHGFTEDQWWAAVSKAAGGKNFDAVRDKYIDGRDPFPFDSLLPLAGMRMVADSMRIPRVGVQTAPDSSGVRVMAVQPGSPAEQAGVKEGDYIVTIAGISLTDPEFADKFRAHVPLNNAAPVEIKVRRASESLTLSATPMFVVSVQYRIDADSRASAKAQRIRSGILRGTVDK
jgi:predicted metalloprotease with PDZ domain